MQAGERCVLVLERDLDLPIPEVGRHLARALGLPMADVTRNLSRTRGILDFDLDARTAGLVADVLSGLGLRAKAVPAAEVPELPPPKLLTDADPTDEGLLIQRVRGEMPPLVPWERVALIAAGTVTFRTLQGRALDSPELERDAIDAPWFLALTGIGAGQLAPDYRPPHPRRLEKVETVNLLDLILVEPADRLRVLAGRFVYDYLGEELAMSSTQNFRRLVTDLGAFAPEALLSRSTMTFLENERPGSHRFGSPEEFEVYVRWLAAWPRIWGMVP